MDFKKFDPKFKNDYELTGPEFGEFHFKREKWLEENRGQFIASPVVPEKIPGLTPRMGPIPATRLWWRKTGSFERNGFFNIHTHVFNTKFIYVWFFVFLAYGWIEAPLHGYCYEKDKDNGERRNSVYDKLQPRQLPLMKIVSRPS